LFERGLVSSTRLMAFRFQSIFYLGYRWIDTFRSSSSGIYTAGLTRRFTERRWIRSTFVDLVCLSVSLFRACVVAMMIRINHRTVLFEQ
jgi:hypothetical protein